jgi:GT2 family glycosyltransferase
MRVSQAPLIAFLDSDDEWLPAKLAWQVPCAQLDPQRTVVYCRHQRVDDQTGRLAPMDRRLPAGDAFAALLRGWTPLLSSIVVTRSVLRDVGGFDIGLPAFNDYDLLLRLAQTGAAFRAVAEVLVVKHDHGGPQISTTPQRLREGFEQMDRKWAPLLCARVGWLAYRRWRAHLYTKAKHAQVRDAVARGQHLKAWHASLVNCRSAPWAARSVVSSLALATLGTRRYAALLRWIDLLTRRPLS